MQDAKVTKSLNAMKIIRRQYSLALKKQTK